MATNYPQYPYNMQTPHNYYYQYPHGQIINPFQTPINNHMYDNHHHHGGVGAGEMINNYGYMNNLTMTNGGNNDDHHHGGVGASEMINNGYMTMTNGGNNDHQETNYTISVDDYDLTDLTFANDLQDILMKIDNAQESNPIIIPQETTAMTNTTISDDDSDNHHHHHHRGVGACSEMINNGYMMNNMTMTNGGNNDHQGAQETNNYDLTDFANDLQDFLMFDNNTQETNPIIIPQETTTNTATISDDDSDDYLKQLPVGYRFLPNDNELVYYLRMKVNNEALPSNRLRTIDLYQYSPQDLAHVLGRNEEDGWYFFTRLNSKNKGAKYASRTTPNGNWKATSGDNQIMNNGAGEEQVVIGTRKALVYYEGKSKTNWIMHEYRLKHHSEVAGILVLCRIHKNHNNKAGN